MIDTQRSVMVGDDLVTALRGASTVVALPGAGVPAESSIPTFRDVQEGLWAKYDPMALATPERFVRDLELVTHWYNMPRRQCAAARPNVAYIALAELEQRLRNRDHRLTLLTQNVDRLHQQAGSRCVVELHSSLSQWRCTSCG